MKNKQILGNIFLISAALFWGVAFVFQRVAMFYTGPVAFNAARMTLAALAVGVVSAAMEAKTRRAESSPGIAKSGAEYGAAEPGHLINSAAYAAQKSQRSSDSTLAGGICCGVLLAMGSVLQQAGLIYTEAGKAGFINALYILLVPVINFVIFKKSAERHVWLAVLLGAAGLYFLCMTESLSLARGDALICISAVMFSGQILCVDHFVPKSDPVRMSAVEFASAAIISWVGAFIMETPDPSGIMAALIPLLFCGFVSGGLAYTLQIIAQKYTDPATASLLMSLESVFALIAGALFLHEQMSLRELLGCALMFAAVILVQLPDRPRRV